MSDRKKKPIPLNEDYSHRGRIGGWTEFDPEETEDAPSPQESDSDEEEE